MAGKPKHMSQIKQLIRFHQQDTGIKTIARELSISRNTVKPYLSKITGGELDLTELHSLDDPVLEARLFADTPSYKENRYEQLKCKLAYISEELKKPGVTRHLLWEEYKQPRPDGYEYTQFCHHLTKYLLVSNPELSVD